MDEQPTLDDIWVSRLASKLGIAMAQLERAQLEIEILQEQLKKYESESQDKQPSLNGEVLEPIT